MSGIKVGARGSLVLGVLILVAQTSVRAATIVAEPLNPVAHCKSYSEYNMDECVDCEQRFWLRQSNPKSITEKPSCQPCISGCLECKNGEVCLNCDEDHTQKQGSTCELCDSNCVTCAADPSVCLSCPRFSSLDKKTGRCSWTFRVVLGFLALVAFALLLVVLSILCKGKKKKGKRKLRVVPGNILEGEYHAAGTDAREQFISTMDMIGIGNNQTDLSEVDRQMEEPLTHTDDYGAFTKNSLGGDRNKKRNLY